MNRILAWIYDYLFGLSHFEIDYIHGVAVMAREKVMENQNFYKEMERK